MSLISLLCLLYHYQYLLLYEYLFILNYNLVWNVYKQSNFCALIKDSLTMTWREHLGGLTRDPWSTVHGKYVFINWYILLYMTRTEWKGKSDVNCYMSFFYATRLIPQCIHECGSLCVAHKFFIHKKEPHGNRK